MEQLLTLSTKTDYTFVVNNTGGTAALTQDTIPGNLVEKSAVSGQTDAEKIADNCRHPKLADMLFYLIRTDKASQRWWDGLSARHQKNLVDCGVCHHMGIQDPNLLPAVAKHPESEAEILKKATTQP